MSEKAEKRKIKGDKIFLRPPTENDFAEFARQARASVQFHRGRAAAPQTKPEFDEYVAKAALETTACFLICEIENGKIAGAITLSQIFRGGFQNAYLGYYLFADATGKGLMNEAVALVLAHAFRTLKLHRVEANVQPENAASIRVLQRGGFVKEGFSEKYLKIGGRWRDHERWAIIVENWRNNKT